jgi:hypothetical protein
MLLPNMEPKNRQNRCWMLLGSVLGYVIIPSMLGDNLLISTSYWQLAGWSCFEGAWILITLAAWANWKDHSPIISLRMVTAAIGYIASCLVVLDIPRASCFAFPLIFVAMAALTRTLENKNPHASIRP